MSSKMITIEPGRSWYSTCSIVRFSHPYYSKKYNPTKSSWDRIKALLNKHPHAILIEDGALEVVASFEK